MNVSAFQRTGFALAVPAMLALAVVQQAHAQTTRTLAGTSGTPVSLGATTTFSAQVVGFGAVAPTGSVSFSSDVNGSLGFAPLTALGMTGAIAAGGGHTCARNASGGVKCWGLNQYGQLGNNSLIGSGQPHPAPFDVAGIAEAVALQAGDNFNCVLTSAGTVRCWGANYSGQLGRSTGGQQDSSPGDVANLTGAVAVTAGFQHACALKSAGTVTCWGSNLYGQSGNSDVQALTGVVAVSAGGYHTCALISSGKVWCWGYGGSGQLGSNGYDGQTHASPVEVVGLSGIVAISAGGSHTCALTGTGTVKCWGQNTYGQLGNTAGAGSYSGQPLPNDVPGLSGIVAVSAGGDHTCALTNTGAMKCWGSNQYGQLGNGGGFGSGSPFPAPTDVTGLSGVTTMSAGGGHSCAVVSGGSVKCWGYNLFGQLGDGVGTGNSSTPGDVTGGVTAAAVPLARLSTASLSVGTHTITMSYPGDGNFTSSSGSATLTVIGAPTVTAIGPTSGPGAGGTVVTVTGTNFASVTSVTFGGVAAIYSVNSTTQITATTPAGVGVVDVVVTAGSNASATSAADRFTYIPAPTVTSISPTSGLEPGGATVTVTGASFDNASSVRFGGQDAASFTVDSATKITAVSPPGSGVVDIRVTTPGGVSATSAADVFTYIPPPDLWSVNPAYGRIQGGAQVTIKGVNLHGVTSLTFGGTPAMSMTVVDSTTILATVPPHAAGLVDVVATASYGTSTKSNFFFYLPPAQIQSVTPSSGPTTGNTTVTIVGPGVIHATGVSFGGVPATSFDTSSGDLTAVTPAHVAGSVDVAVAALGGDDTSPGAFTFVKTPTALSLTAMTTPAYRGQATKLVARVTTQDAGAPTGNVTLSSSIDGALTPVALDGVASSPSFATGDSHSCAVTAAGALKCWGANTYGQLGNSTGLYSSNAYSAPADTGLSDMVSVTAGQRHTCSLSRAGSVKCWGVNQYGQLGNGTGVATVDAYPTPADVAGLSGIVAIAAGYSHTCAITLAGGVKCWGRNNGGQLGQTPSGSSATPFDVPGVSGAVAIAAGESHSCALLNTGGVKCWGLNTRGQLGVTGVSNSATPLDVTGLTSGATSIAAGQDFTCAATVSGGVKCWGNNRYGQLGNATGMGITTSNPTPADVASLSGVVAITAGAKHACAITNASEIDCWGGNDNGQLGNTLAGTTPSPVVFGSGAGSVAVFGGANHTCALSFTGTLSCAGLNSYGQFGVASLYAYSYPVDMSGMTPVIAARAIVSMASLSAGSHVITAVYGGDGNHSGSNNTAAQDVIGPPVVTGLSPAAGPLSGGGSVVIGGSNFNAASGLTFGGVSAPFTVNSDAQITATAPPHAAGAVDVTVTSPAGSNTPNAASAYNYVAAPTVAALAAPYGPEAGGRAVTISGTDLLGATSVTFGGVAAASFTVNSATQITATSPAGTGSVHVVVVTAGGASATGAGSQYSYIPAPTVTGVSPASGPLAGGAPVTITGTNFNGAYAVWFGSEIATSLVVVDSTTVTAVTPVVGAVQPAGVGPTSTRNPGPVNVRVATQGGDGTGTGLYTYVAAPAIASVSPATGLPTGGTSVVITGTNFSGATAVTFGGTSATSFTVDSATQITAVTPAHAAGSVDVAVTTVGGTVTSSRAYSYELSPTAMLLGTAKTPTFLGESATFTARMTSYGGGAPTGNVQFSSNKDGALGSAALNAFGGGSVAAGGYHSCALKSDGTVACWGNNFYGQLGNSTGNGTFNAHPIPTDVAGLGNVAALAAGNHHTCALASGGMVKCWGYNSYGQLGNGGTADSSVPTNVSGLSSGVRALAAGENHTCALTGTGGVKCWGINFYGQLGNSIGNGTFDAHPVPADVAELDNVVAIFAGKHHTCALTGGGTVSCWGWNGDGQLGNSTGNGTQGANPTPVVVTGLSGLATLAGGGYHTCASTSAGRVKCWGNNFYGQLGNSIGNGTFDAHPVPAEVAGLGSAVAIFAGNHHTCALTGGGTVSCWGWNGDGQLGNSTANGTQDANPTPVVVTGLSGIATLAGGGYHTCALTGTGGVKCWGINFYGQLGSVTNAGIQNPNPSPLDVNGISAAINAKATFTTTALTPGSHTIAASYNGDSNHGGSSATVAQDVIGAPVVSSLSPAAGPLAGGTSVVITGTNVTGASAVTFGGTAATTFTVNSATSVTAMSPAHAVGVVDVVITTPAGASATNASARFGYVGAPTLANVSPNAGPAAGGASVVIAGTNLSTASSVTFDGATAAFTVDSDTQITATTPAHAAGSVAVAVATAGGTATLGDGYTYVALPTLTSVSPASGLALGGTSVTLTGTNLTGASGVTFGGVAATGVTVVSATTVSAVTPAHGAGAVDVVVTTPGGTATRTGGFTYTNGTLQVSGPAGMIALGPQEGPFNPPSFSYLLKSSAGPLNWQIGGVPDWLTVSPALSGSTDATGTTVTFTANTNATTKAVGAYGLSNVTFTNTDNGQGNTSRGAGLTVSPKACEVVTKGPEFNGDAKGDILWRSDAGAIGLWLMNGTALASGPSLGTVAADWRLVGAADFNGDGKSDLLWRNTVTGTAAVWFVSGVSVTGTVNLGTVTSDWHIVGAGDFDGDRNADVLWRHDSGTLAIWYGTGATGQGRVVVGTVDMTWRLAGIADFDGDGKSDLLWRSTSGTVAVWLMNGAAMKGSASLGAVGADWRIHGVGDFNGDGKADILWRGDAGVAALWLMNGAALASSATIGTIGPDWHVAGVNDYNGDGRADLLWRQDSGTLGIWLMNGATPTSSGGFAGVGLDWHVINGEHDRPLTLIAPGPC